MSATGWRRDLKIILCNDFVLLELTKQGGEKVAFWTGNPVISGKSRLVKYCILTRNILVFICTPIFE